ncbi:MAG: hypothetical protein KGI27_06250 [Thaumarchaeota archaeon]|nr:hypothetical protein [Nitrososphaerota archaeon]
MADDTPKISRSTLGGSGNAPSIVKAQESVNAPSIPFKGSQNAPPVTSAKITKVSSKPISDD